MAPKYKLTYFPAKALGEPIRLLLSYMGESFEDFRFEREDWPNIKPNMPWGKTPVLEVDGQMVSQHVAITRYLGKQAGLGGKDAWEDLRIDEVVDVINDLRSELAKHEYEKDEKRKAEIKGPLLGETVPYYMKKLEAQVKSNNGYLAAGKLTWADVYWTGVYDYLSYMHGSDIAADYPAMTALRSKVEALPKIKQWVETRPHSQA